MEHPDFQFGQRAQFRVIEGGNVATRHNERRQGPRLSIERPQPLTDLHFAIAGFEPKLGKKIGRELEYLRPYHDNVLWRADSFEQALMCAYTCNSMGDPSFPSIDVLLIDPNLFTERQYRNVPSNGALLMQTISDLGGATRQNCFRRTRFLYLKEGILEQDKDEPEEPATQRRFLGTVSLQPQGDVSSASNVRAIFNALRAAGIALPDASGVEGVERQLAQDKLTDRFNQAIQTVLSSDSSVREEQLSSPTTQWRIYHAANQLRAEGGALPIRLQFESIGRGMFPIIRELLKTRGSIQREILFSPEHLIRVDPLRDDIIV